MFVSETEVAEWFLSWGHENLTAMGHLTAFIAGSLLSLSLNSEFSARLVNYSEY